MPAEIHSRRVKAAPVVKGKAEAAKEAVLVQLRRAGLSRQAALIEQCGTREWQWRCGCGADLGTVKQSCHQYFCPRCQRIKAYKIAKEVEAMLQELRKTNAGLRVLWGTFTLPVCGAAGLRKQLDTLSGGFAKLLRKAPLKKYIIAAVRFIEFGNNCKLGRFHPHLHALIVVKATYFSKGYLSQQAWLTQWRAATKSSQVTQINLRRIKADPKRALSLEKNAGGMAGYALKPIQLAKWFPANLAVLSKAIQKRHLCEFMGGFRPIKKQFKRQRSAPCLCEDCQRLQAT